MTLDITMPEMTRGKAYRRMKEETTLRAILIVIVTGFTHDFKQLISSRTQVPPLEGYLGKPVKPEDLLAEVKRLVGYLSPRNVMKVHRVGLSGLGGPVLGKDGYP